MKHLPCACGHKLKTTIWAQKSGTYRIEVFHNKQFVDGWTFRDINDVLTAPVEAVNYLAKIRRVFIARGNEVCAEWWEQVSQTLRDAIARK